MSVGMHDVNGTPDPSASPSPSPSPKCIAASPRSVQFDLSSLPGEDQSPTKSNGTAQHEDMENRPDSAQSSVISTEPGISTIDVEQSLGLHHASTSPSMQSNTRQRYDTEGSTASAPSIGYSLSFSVGEAQGLIRGESKKVRNYYKQQNSLSTGIKEDNQAVQRFQNQWRRKSNQSPNGSIGDVLELKCGDQNHKNTVEDTENVPMLNMNNVNNHVTDIVVIPDDNHNHNHGSGEGHKESLLSLRDEEKDLRRTERLLALASLIINVILLIIKLVAVILSGSLSIVSSLVDSAVDITSGLVIWVTARAIRNRDPYLYPTGRTRLEPLALIVISVIMAVASLQVIIQSIEGIVKDEIHPKVDWITIGIMIATILIKFVLAIVCYIHRALPSIRVLGQDHRNDCVSNAVAIVCAFLGDKYWNLMDPIGAIVVSLYIAVTWFITGYGHAVMLSGRAAKNEYINRIIRVCVEHDSRIKALDTVLVYHWGTKYLVEVHVVMPRDMSVQCAHDICEPLQLKIEHLPYVERAFLHIDYETDHKSIDEHKAL